MKLYIIWALLCVLAQVILTAFQLILKNKFKKPAVRFIIIFIKIIIAFAFAVLVMAGSVILRPVQPVMFALYAVLFADAVSDLCYSVFYLIAKKERRFAVSKTLSIVFGILFIVYGTLNMQIIKPKYHTYSSAKLESDHTFIY
ncbi:MAG: hypothetical protein IKH13_04055, partial [Clostridia bacterium]|nr:hypothetical protein [Clostridia bacterium]